MSLLMQELHPMQVNEHKEIDLPVKDGGKISVTKVDVHAYTGFIEQGNKKIADFITRTIPSLGILLLTYFELYDVEDLEKDPVQPDISAKVQQMVDERIALHSLINKVVDNKIQQRDAIQQLMLAKISESLKPSPPPMPEKVIEKVIVLENPKKEKKQSPLVKFIDERKDKKLKKNEFHIIVAKGEDSCACPDCGSQIFNGKEVTPCVCFGDEGKVFLRKSQDGKFSVSFGNGWDKENIEMLLEVLRSKHGK